MSKKKKPVDEFLGCNLRGRLMYIQELLAARKSKQAKVEIESLLQFVPDQDSDDTPTRAMESEELATILAALRTYQEAGYGEPENRPERIHMIATDADFLVSLDDDAIDTLCEELNCGVITPTIAADRNAETPA